MLTALSVLISGLWVSPAQAEGFTIVKRHVHCRYASLDGHEGYTDAEAKRTIECAVDHYPVVGGVSKALYIANRESGYECGADNPYSTAAGVYQMVAATWSSWSSKHIPWLNARRWRLRRHVKGCRPNIMTAIRQVHQSGSWAPWGG